MIIFLKVEVTETLDVVDDDKNDNRKDDEEYRPESPLDVDVPEKVVKQMQ